MTRPSFPEMWESSGVGRIGLLRSQETDLSATNPGGHITIWQEGNMFPPTLFTLVAILAIGNPGCGESQRQSNPGNGHAPAVVPQFRKQRVPTSERSRTASAGVAPSLVRGLKVGYDAFERTGKPPNARVWKKKYVFATDAK